MAEDIFDRYLGHMNEADLRRRAAENKHRATGKVLVGESGGRWEGP